MHKHELSTIVNPDAVLHAWEGYKKDKKYPNNYNVKITLHDLIKIIETIVNPNNGSFPALRDSEFPPIGKYALSGDEPTKIGDLSRSYMTWVVRQTWVKDKYPSFYAACEAKTKN